MLRSSFLLQGPPLQTQPLFQWTIFLRGRAAKGRSKKNSGEYIVCRLYSEQVGYRGWKSFNYFACSSFTTMVGSAALRVSLTNCSIASEWVLSSWSLEEEHKSSIGCGLYMEERTAAVVGPPSHKLSPNTGGPPSYSTRFSEMAPLLPQFQSGRWGGYYAASHVNKNF